MAAFRYLGATISKIDKESDELIASAVIFINPAVIELNYRTTLYDVAKRYRQLKSIDDTANIMVVKINDAITLLNNKTAMMFGIAINPFSRSAMLQTRFSSTREPTNTPMTQRI